MDYTIKEIEEMINKNNIVIASQSKELVPADKKIYELRDTIACTNSKPLIVSSILSKKIASGANNIVIDITYGSGAFMKTKKDAEELKKIMYQIGEKLGVKVKAVISSMETPLRTYCSEIVWKLWKQLNIYEEKKIKNLIIL